MNRTGRRTGLTRFELVATVLVVALAVVGIAALVPGTGALGGAGTAGPAAPGDGGRHPVATLDDRMLGEPRAAAGLAPCPATPDAPVAERGPLAGIVVPCLGAPGSVRPAAALAGRETLLNVWASWCGPCREELPALNAYAQRPGALPVVGINVQDNPVSALKLLTKLGVKLPMLIDSGDAVAHALRVAVLPGSYLLGPEGTVRHLLPAVAYTSPDEVAAAVDKVRRAGS